MDKYYKVYNFTNENVSCLDKLYNFENSRVLSVAGSGDQYFASILNGAKQVDLFDINPTSYLYVILKFYAIRELTYEEFYDFLVLKNLNNINTYNKLEPVLPIEVLKYYKYLIKNNSLDSKDDLNFRNDGINLHTKKNQKYYFKNNYSVIPYFMKDNYDKLQNLLKKMPLPNFFKVNLLEFNFDNDTRYDILLTSNIYNHIKTDIFDYIRFLKKIDIPEIQAGYDWYGFHLNEFLCMGCKVDAVVPSSPSEYDRKKNFVYSIKK